MRGKGINFKAQVSEIFRMRMRRKYFWALALSTPFILGLGYYIFTKTNPNGLYKVGSIIDELNGVPIYYNGGVYTIQGRNLSAEGYNLGIRYQCVEFVKRYYFEVYHHRMPDSYGHAKDFFDPLVADGELNRKRGLIQYTNGSLSKPLVGDLVVYRSWFLNPYGHVAIVAKVEDTFLEIAQQNPGPFSGSRETLTLRKRGNKWYISDNAILGWLRFLGNAKNPKPQDF